MLRRKVLSLATVLVFLITSGVAVAQDATTPPPAAPPAADVVVGQVAPPTPAGEEVTEEILVTGTRIPRKDLTTPAPVTVVSADTIEESGKVSIGDFLQALPEQAGGINTQLNNGGDGSSRVNLRNLGLGRTLVLLNGRRFVPAGGNDNIPDFSSVDLNAIPAAAIERIEILKDGASAVYGSDAIAGVINIITKRRYDGTEVRAFSGVSSEGDGETYDLSLTTGRATQRGSLLFSAGYTRQKEVFARNRSYSSFDTVYDFATGQVTQSGSDFIPGGIILVDPADPAFAGGMAEWQALLASGPSGAYTRDLVTGQWREYLGSNLATDPLSPGDGFNYQQYQYLVTPNERLQLYGAGDANLGDAARGYFELSFVNRRSRATGLAPEPFGNIFEGITISADNGYNPFGVDFTSENSVLGRRLVEFGGRNSRGDVNTYRGVLGIDGSLPEVFGPASGWAWDLSLNYGRTEGTKDKTGNLRRDKFATAVGPSYTDGAGVLQCGSGPLPDGTAPFPGCVPLNLFGGPGSITADQMAPLIFQGVARQQYSQAAFQANLSGDVIRLFGDRPLAFAAGYEYRDESAAFIPDQLTAAGDATGNKGAATQGSYSVNEAYGELSIPILTARPFAENLEATAATRFSDYSSFGSKWTYKFGARWSIVNDFTVRGTFSTAYRAPSVGDLFQGRIDNFEFTTDPCSGAGSSLPACAAAGVPPGFSDPLTQHRTINGGNPDLEPETADIFTVGAVFVPRWVPQLSFTIDYFNVDLDNTIAAGLGGQFILESCYTKELSQYCPLVHRAGSGTILAIDDIGINVGATQTSGIDLAARYSLPSPYGRFRFSADATYLIEYDQTQPDGRIYQFGGRYDDAGEVSYPRWKATASVLWGLRSFGAGLSTRFISSFTECADDDGFASKGAAGQCNDALPEDVGGQRLTRKVSPYYVFDGFVSYDRKNRFGNTAVAVGMTNIFDNEPNQVYSGPENHTDYALYDLMGRFVYVRLSHAL